MVVKGLADEAEHHLQPEVVQGRGALPFIKVDQPPATSFVFVVFPHGFDALLQIKSRIKACLQDDPVSGFEP